MTPRRPNHPLRQFGAVLAAAGVLLGLLALSAEPAWTDDKQLLRFNTAEPFLFIMLDNSSSMTLKIGPGQNFTPGYGESPESRIYQAKAALYNVFEQVDDVRFGFASYNQDEFRAVSKHYAYYLPRPLTDWTTDFPWPAVDADGPTEKKVDFDNDNDGTPDVPDPILDGDVDGDILSFGPRVVPSGEAGSCAAPLPLGALFSATRNKINAFAHEAGDCASSKFTTMWISTSGPPRVWRLQTCRDDPAQAIGQATLTIRFILDLVSSCPSSFDATKHYDTRADLLTETGTDALNEFFMIDHGVPGDGNANNQDPEDNAGFWPFKDAFSAANWCGGDGNCHPFTGKGWEGNYDSWNAGEDPTNVVPAAIESAMTNVDPLVDDPDPSESYNAKIDPTTFDALGRPLDRGDMIPLDWRVSDSRTPFLKRLWPGYPGPGTPDFRGSSAFEDTAQDFGGPPPTGPLALAPRFPHAVVAEGESPLAKAVNDFRCWFMGQDGPGAGKCSSSAFFADGGYAVNACANDPDFGCTRNYFVIITDGEDSLSQGEDARADVASMWNALGNVRTWVLNLGAPGNQPDKCNNQLENIVNPNGECVNIDSYQTLARTLAGILGIIRSETRAFASAAVPSVQASVSQAVYISSFTPTPPSESPLGTQNPIPGVDSVWDGHLNAFLKPVPLVPQGQPDAGKPDTSLACSPDPVPLMPPHVVRQCFLWDAGLQMEGQIGTDPTFLGSAADLRRVYYTQQGGAGTWEGGRRFLEHTTDATAAATRYDLWRGLGIPFNEDDPSAIAPASPVDQAAQTAANQVIRKTFSLKTHTFTDTVSGSPRTITNILGDIFHSNPLMVGNPPNTLYFVSDPSYRVFENRHRNRRKVLLVGANDGMLHALDAGLPHFVDITTSVDPGTGAVTIGSAPRHVEFDAGTGREIWAYLPRTIMRTVRRIAQGTTQQWGVDGAVASADVFIDPTHAGVPTAGQREWRTVAVGGLREGGTRGGSGYYAIDMTQPDALDDRTTDATLGKMPFAGQIGAAITGLGATGSAGAEVPTCLDTGTASCAVSGSSVVPYPSPLWEFIDGAYNADGTPAIKDADGDLPGDSDFDESTARWIRLDEDTNLEADLGFTWSVPNIGRIRLSDSAGATITKYVAVFGGGMDAGLKTAANPDFGNWIYIVDIETGRAIYKREIEGAVPAEPAAIDTDQDSFLDRIYFGTTAGFLYRIDLNGAVDGSGNLHFPQLELMNPDGLDGFAYTAQRVLNEYGTSTPTWEPVKIFDANVDTVEGNYQARSIYHRPTVALVAQLGRWAITFGVGDREDLWSRDTKLPLTVPPVARNGRFYIFVDESDVRDAGGTLPTLPFDESDFTQILADGADAGTNILLNAALWHRGWYLVLNRNERVITNAFALSGILEFATYEPLLTQTDPDTGDAVVPSCSTQAGNDAGTYVCGRAGTSRIFVTFTTSGDKVLDVAGVATRHMDIGTFVTEPYTEQGQSKNTGISGGTSHADELTPSQLTVMNRLRELFPTNCRFANYRIDIKTITGDTGVITIAPVPICIAPKNWKEF